MQDLWFLRSAHRLMLININMKFLEDILNRFQVTDEQSSKENNSKSKMQELWFLHSAPCLMLIDTDISFVKIA